MIESLQNIQTPAYVADMAAIRRNLAKARKLKAAAGVEMLLATKAFSMFSVFPTMREVLDGTTASGLYEARLGYTHFGKNVHTYSPAYTEDDLMNILNYSSHIYFNSVSQLKRFAGFVRKERPDAMIGLRVNPRLSQVKNSDLYDPSALCSRFGVQKKELTKDVLAHVDILHFHNLCENLADDSKALIEHVAKNFGSAIKQVSQVNFGGGHYYTHPDYDLAVLVAAIKKFKRQFKVKVTLESGGAHVFRAGYLVASVLDIIENEKKIAILDASASTHMPDVLEVPYTPDILYAGKEDEKTHTYILGGNTCMTGDVIGTYSFDEPLRIGQKLVFLDMMQYSMCKNTTFNGVPLPDIGILHEDGRYQLVKRFGYGDFEGRLS